uniref:acetyl-CoA carboxylase carboxyltransferase beta subunit n=1 Tax=Linum lewisii TaxID=586382 RepID=UPI001D11A629|nr:acetyl-CoA carboxylase carboxyltransferase beta subunit [Linum lewisii]UBA16935.1 acetyl-CoA carboxylase carboxyltransferase beta subunit [Linum lewisii]
MEKGWINSMLSNVGLEYKCRLSKSMDNWGPLENTDGSQSPILNDTDKNTDSSSYSNVDHLIGVKNIRDFGADDTFLVMYSSRDNYSIYFDIEKLVFEITNQVFLLFPSQFFSCFSSYSNSPSLPNGSRSDEDISLSNTKWNNYINSCIDSYFRSQISIDSSDSENFTESENKNISGICIDSYSLTDSENFTESENEIDSYILTDSENFTESENEICCLSISTNDLERPKDYSHLWVQCDDCYELNYKKYFKSKMNICEHCGYHLEMTSSDRIELLIDPDTWVPMDEDMQCIDPIEFDSDFELGWDEFESDCGEFESDSSEFYIDRFYSYQEETGLTEAVQTGTGQLNGITLAMGVMDFRFIGGSMGSAVGEKITRLIEYAAKNSLPLILVCASGGARMQEGSLSLMQMAKISSALYDYQVTKKLFFVSILTSPTTGGVTASFGMLGDIIIAEPNATIAFAGKRVIEQTLNIEVPEGVQETEFLFDKGLFDLIVPRNPLKGVLNELFHLHALTH